MLKNDKVYLTMKFALEAMLDLIQYLATTPDDKIDEKVIVETIQLAEKAVLLCDVAMEEPSTNTTIN